MEYDLAGSQFSPESSANSAMSWDDFYNMRGRQEFGDVGWVDLPADHWFTKFGNFFYGHRDRFAADYDAYLTNNQRQYEQQNINDARRFQEYLESTKYQRMSKDLQAAGLNPYLALQNGVGSTSVQPGSTSYSTSAKKFENKKSNASSAIASIITTALRVAAIFALA